MTKIAFVIFTLFLASTAAFAQTPYKCKVGGSVVYQDQPCAGTVRRSDAMPTKAADAPSSASVDQQRQAQQAKLEKDKEYINQQVKARNLSREKDDASDLILRCDADVASIHQKINQIAANSPQGAPLNAAGAMVLQLDQQRRQTEIVALQSQATAKRAECDLSRQEYDRKYRKQ